MFRRPGFSILVFLITILTIGFPSCDGPDYVALTDIDQVSFYDYSSRTYLQEPFTTDSDSIALNIVLAWTDFSYIEFEGNMAEAWAFQPSEPLLANEIRDIRIFCDRFIYGIDAGRNIAPFINFGFTFNLDLSLPEFLAELPSKGDIGYGINWIQVMLSPKPLSGSYTFIVEIEDNNGHVFRGTSPTIQYL